MRQILLKTYDISNSARTTVSKRTLFTYLKWYREGRFLTLVPDERKDAGSVGVIPKVTLKKAFNLNRNCPNGAVREIIEILELSGNAPKGLIKDSTLSRIISNNIQTTPKTKSTKVLRRFQRENVYDTWQSDIKISIYPKNPRNPKEYIRTCLICFLGPQPKSMRKDIF
jgi:hypothetical protein